MSKNPSRTLADIDLLQALDADDVDRLEALCLWKSYRAGEEVLSQSSITGDVFFITKGLVRIVIYSYSGREVGLATLGAGEYFGEIAAIDEPPRTATVVAVESTELAVLRRSDFMELLSANAAVAFKILERLARIVRASDERIMDLSTLGALQRVYSLLLRLAKPDAAVRGQWVIRPLPVERELASLAGTTRETVSRSLGQLRKAGLTVRKDRNFYLLDRKRLEQIVNALASPPV